MEVKIEPMDVLDLKVEVTEDDDSFETRIKCSGCYMSFVTAASHRNHAAVCKSANAPEAAPADNLRSLKIMELSCFSDCQELNRAKKVEEEEVNLEKKVNLRSNTPFPR